MAAATSKSEGSEKRHFTRINFDFPVHIEQGGIKYKSKVVDISLKGILIEDAVNSLQYDKTTYLSIHLDNEIDITMQVQWNHSNKGCSGFHWTKLDIESMIHLRRLLELNNGDTELLERELIQLSHH